MRIFDIFVLDRRPSSVCSAVAEISNGLNPTPHGLWIEPIAQKIIVFADRPISLPWQTTRFTEFPQVVFENAANQDHGSDRVLRIQKFLSLNKEVIMNARSQASRMS